MWPLAPAAVEGSRATGDGRSMGAFRKRPRRHRVNPVPRQKPIEPILRCVADTSEHLVTETLGATSIFPWCSSHQNFVRMYSTPLENACSNSAPSSYPSLNPVSAAATLSSGVP